MRKLERDVTLSGSGEPTRRNIGRTAGSADVVVVAPKGDQEIDLDKAGALNKFFIVPLREAVATMITKGSSY